jgi:membrane-bound metal-dependent hydrolase YbcI (DUF457 family)
MAFEESRLIMPLPIAHGLLGASIVAALHPAAVPGRKYIPLLMGAFLAIAADFDFLLVFALHDKTWHRDFSHSLVFALLVCGLFALALGKRRLKEALAYGLAFASHGILDFMTSKVGGGVELFWPFSQARMMLSWWGLSEAPFKLSVVQILGTLVLELALFTPLLITILLLKRSFAYREG